MSDERYLGAMAIAARLGLSRGTVNELIRKGVLAAIRPGRNWKVAESEVRRFEQSNRFARSRRQQIWNAQGVNRAVAAASA